MHVCTLLTLLIQSIREAFVYRKKRLSAKYCFGYGKLSALIKSGAELRLCTLGLCPSEKILYPC